MFDEAEPIMKSPAVGRWRIVEMELWETEAVELLGPAHIEFDDEGLGDFRFIAVEGWLDVHPADHLGPSGVEFSWEGRDEFDHACGRGWAVVTENGELSGRIFLHLGDDSGFRAVQK